MANLMVEESLRRGLEGLRGGFQADGADLRLRSWDGSTAEVELVFGPDVCVECIVPAPVLHAIVEGALREQVPEVDAIRIIDPRDQPLEGEHVTDNFRSH